MYNERRLGPQVGAQRFGGECSAVQKGECRLEKARNMTVVMGPVPRGGQHCELGCL